MSAESPIKLNSVEQGRVPITVPSTESLFAASVQNVVYMGIARITVKESPMNPSGETRQRPIPEEGERSQGEQTLSLDDSASKSNLDKIRDILFGAQLRDHDRRFAQLEQYLVSESAALRQDLQRRFDVIAGDMKKEFEGLVNRLTRENEARNGSVIQLTQEINQLVSSLGEKTQQLEQRTSNAQRELEQQIRSRSAELATDFQAKYTELGHTLNRAVDHLQAAKTDRASLAAILMEVSQRLADGHSTSGYR